MVNIKKPFDSYDEQFGNVSAPAQVLDAVPETFFSALRNSAWWIFPLAAVRSIYVSPPYDYFVLRQSSRPPVRLPSKNASGRLNLRGRFSIPKLPIIIINLGVY